MGLEQFVLFNLTLLAAILSPGPPLPFLSRTAIAEGRATGLSAALGLGLMAALWTLAALLGLDALFAVFPAAYPAVELLGAAYLIWIAAQTWRHARMPMATAPAIANLRAFRHGMLVNLGNPKSVLFAAAVLVVVFPHDLGAADKILIFFNHLAVEWLMQPALAVLLSTDAVCRRCLGAKTVLDRAAACVLGALGLRLLFERTSP